MIDRRFRFPLTLMFALGIAAAAHAQYTSPELMFVYDQGDGTSAHTPKIDRYDPISRQYLGSFGTNFLPAGQVGAMTVMGHDLYFLTNNNIAGIAAVIGFNFSTGTVDYSHAIAGQGFISSMAAVNGKLVLGGFSSGNLYVLDPSAHTSTTTGGAAGINEIISLSGRGSTLAVSGYDNSGTTFTSEYGTYQADSSDTSLTTNFLTTGDNYGSMAMSPDQSGTMRLFGANSIASFSGVEERDALSGNLLDTSDNLAQGSIWVDSSIIATGHNGEFYYLRTDNVVAVANADLPFVFSGTGDPGISLTGTTSGVMVAVYAAPEPGTYAVLAIGCLGLAAKRRRRR